MIGKIKYIAFFLGLVLLTRCANVVAPTGGPKDITPPMVTVAEPANHSVNFNGKKIELTFDEYVTLTNANQEVLISPPVATKPDVKLSGKTVSVKFKDELLPNATYTINFGNAIKDLHEGNTFKDYVYSFATGDHLDSLSIAGKVINADDEKPVDAMFVGLYDGESDSLFHQPTRRAPDFITKTDKDGAFRFEGLPDKQFLVFALNDVNSNLYYDMPNEKVAFLDTLISASDSLSLKLFAFVEADTTQMLLEKKVVEEGLLRFVFRRPADKVRVAFPDAMPDAFRMVKVWSKERDTLSCYFTPNVMDSLWVVVQYDTLINDSTCYALKQRETRQRQRSDKELAISNNLKKKLLMPGEDLILRFSEPVIDVLGDTSLLLTGTDTTFINNRYDFEPVDDYGMAFRLVIPIDDTLSHTLNVADSVFFSVRGRTGKAFSLRFNRARHSDLGNVFVNVEPPAGTQAIVQLLNSRGKVLEERMIDSAQRVAFTQLLPEKYKLRAIIDVDRNGKWSSGNFHRRFLPETIVPYKDELDVKAGWDIDLDEKWILVR